MQSGLLIITFVLALNERKRYRQADRFGKIAIDFVSDALRTFYDDERKSLEEVRKGSFLDASEARIAILSSFQPLLYHAKTVIMHRMGCYPTIQTNGIEGIFEEIEDRFTLLAAEYEPNSRHPEQLTVHIASGSSRILAILLKHESELSGNNFFFLQKLRSTAGRCLSYIRSAANEV